MQVIGDEKEGTKLFCLSNIQPHDMRITTYMINRKKRKVENQREHGLLIREKRTRSRSPEPRSSNHNWRQQSRLSEKRTRSRSRSRSPNPMSVSLNWRKQSRLSEKRTRSRSRSINSNWRQKSMSRENKKRSSLDDYESEISTKRKRFT